MGLRLDVKRQFGYELKLTKTIGILEALKDISHCNVLPKNIGYLHHKIDVTYIFMPILLW